MFPAGPGGDGNLFPPGPGSGPRPGFDFSPDAPNINEFLLPPVPNEYELQNRLNRLRGTSSPPPPPPFFANNAPNFYIPVQTSSFHRTHGASGHPPTDNVFGSQTATLNREKVKESITETKIDIDDSLYELPENSEFELGDGLIENLGTVAGDLLETENITKQEEDVVLEQIKEEYGFEDIKNVFDDDFVPDNGKTLQQNFPFC